MVALRLRPRLELEVKWVVLRWRKSGKRRSVDARSGVHLEARRGEDSWLLRISESRWKDEKGGKERVVVEEEKEEGNGWEPLNPGRSKTTDTPVILSQQHGLKLSSTSADFSGSTLSMSEILRWCIRDVGWI